MVMVTSILYKMRPARLKAKRRLERELARMRLADRLAGPPGEQIVQYVKTLGEVRDSLNYTGEDEPLATWYGWNEFHEYCMRTYRSGNAPWPENEPRLLVIGGRGECTRLHAAMMYKSANPAFRLAESDTGERPGNVAEARELFGDLSMHMGMDECLVYAWNELTVDDLCTIRNSGMYSEYLTSPALTSSALTSSQEVPLSSYPPPAFQAVGGVEIPRFTAEQDHIRSMGWDEALTPLHLEELMHLEELSGDRDRDSRQWMLDQWRCCPRTVGTAGTVNTDSAANSNAASTVSTASATNATATNVTNASATYEWSNCDDLDDECGDGCDAGCDGAPL